MGARLLVPEPWQSQVCELVSRLGLGLDVVRDGEATVHIVADGSQLAGQERREASSSVLYVGGFIQCRAAMATAAELGVSPVALCALLDLLDIKLRNCEFGCF